MTIILAITPFVIFLVWLLLLKTSLLKTSVATLVVTLGLAMLFWKIRPEYLGLSLTKGFFVAWDIFLIITGALFFLEILKHLKIIENISLFLRSISSDYRVQIIMLAWFLESFIEGTAGFGTPAMIVVPLLITIGLSPIKAVIIGLLGNSAAVIFGAAGTPIRVGFAGLATSSVPLTAALINCAGFIVPVFMLWVMVSGQKNKGRQFIEALPFAIFSGLAFVIPSLFFVPLGQEFPSILGSVVGLGLTIVGLRLGLEPKTIRVMNMETIKTEKTLWLKTLTPYVMLIGLLVLGKYFFGSINPGLAFMTAGVVTIIIFKNRYLSIPQILSKAAKKALGPFLIILVMSFVVQIMINSGQIEIIARLFRTSLLPFLTPFIGAFGAFITGSATVSNLMFGAFVNSASVAMGISSVVILALQLVGAAAGNMIALADILAAETVAGLKNQERSVLLGTVGPCVIYVIIVGIIGMLIA